MVTQMPDTATRLVERRLRRALLDIGDELRRARLNAGLRQRDVANAMRVSPSSVSRIERGLVGGVTVGRVSRQAAVVGLVVRVNLYPAGRPVRDVAQLRLLERLRARIHPSWRWRVEVGLALGGDLRAFDAMADRSGLRVAIEAITRLADIQAQVRSGLLKQRDSGVERLVLLVADTHANRRALREGIALLRGDLPLGTRAVLTSLGLGDDPGANGIVLL